MKAAGLTEQYRLNVRADPDIEAGLAALALGRGGRGTVTSQKDDGQNHRRCGTSRARDPGFRTP